MTTRYVATINVPGYSPMDDDPPVFDTAREAWAYLAAERQLAEDELENDGERYTQTVADLESYASSAWLVCDFERVDTVYGSTPGYVGTHDLGLAYCVSIAEPDDDETNGD